LAYLLINGKPFEEKTYDKEEELEDAAVNNKNYIFGSDVVYFNYKHRVGSKDVRGIPDGFLVDFSDPENPQLFYVEYELQSHQLYDHIGAQIMKFYASFETGKEELLDKLINLLNEDKNLMKEVKAHLDKSPFANEDSFVNYLIYKRDLGIIIVIDEQTEDLNALLNKLSEGPEVVVLKKYQYRNELVYQYTPFREGITESRGSNKENLPKKEVDTIVCPAREEGFNEAFLNKNAWWAIRISPTLIPQLKYIAMYETYPISTINWYAKIKNIKPYKNTGKYIVYVEKRKRIHPIKLDANKRQGIAPQAPRYTTYKRLLSAKKISQLW